MQVENLQIASLVLCVYLFSVLMVKMAYNNSLRKLGSDHAATKSVKRIIHIPVINTIVACVMVVINLLSIFGIRLKESKKDDGVIDFSPSPHSELNNPFSKRVYQSEPITRQEEQLIEIIEKIDIEKWQPDYNCYKVPIGDITIKIQQMSSPFFMGGDPIRILIGDNYECRHESLSSIYCKIQAYYDKKAAEKKFTNIMNKAAIVSDILKKIKSKQS